MKIAIVDDNRQEQEKLTDQINAWAGKNSIAVSARIFDSGEEFSQSLNREQFDIVFMDIIMDGQNGIETALRLRSISINILLIFITSSMEFMAQAFPCHAFDYIMKPCSEERITQVMDKAKRTLGKTQEVIEISSEKFLPSEIFCAYSDSNYCEIFNRNKRYKVRISFTDLTKMLSPYPSFMVIGRGVLVNFDNTSHISGYDCVMTNGDNVPVSRRKIRETEQAFMNRQFSRMLADGR